MAAEHGPVSAGAAAWAGPPCGADRPPQTSDVVDASVVLVARLRGDRVVTSDPDDIATIDAGLELVPL